MGRRDGIIKNSKYPMDSLLDGSGIGYIGLSSSSAESKNPRKWRGENMLGFALMEVRDELRRVN